MKRSAKKTATQLEDPPLYVGDHWGEPPSGEIYFAVDRVAKELEITGAMPDYVSSDHPCDLVRQYEVARKNQSIGKQKTGKDAPHIRFANADGDDELIDFVRNFGTVVIKNLEMLPSDPRVRGSAGDTPPQTLMRARQNLQELRSEQRIYKAALGLLLELAEKPAAYDADRAKERMGEIASYVQNWQR